MTGRSMGAAKAQRGAFGFVIVALRGAPAIGAVVADGEGHVREGGEIGGEILARAGGKLARRREWRRGVGRQQRIGTREMLARQKAIDNRRPDLPPRG